MGDHVKAGHASDPFLIAGYTKRVLHVSHQADQAVSFNLEADLKGDGKWTSVAKLDVPAKSYRWQVLDPGLQAEWLRLIPDKDCQVSAYFHMSNESPHPVTQVMGKALSTQPMLVRPPEAIATWRQALAMPTTSWMTSWCSPQRRCRRRRKTSCRSGRSSPNPPSMRLPLSSLITRASAGACRRPTPPSTRLCSVESGKSKASVSWATGTAVFMRSRARTISRSPWITLTSSACAPSWTHRLPISDYCTWRGLLVLAGAEVNSPRGKVITSADGKASLWLGKADDLWSLGKPAGHGGPWLDTAVKAGAPSDPYLMTNYDRKTLTLSHTAAQPVVITVEVDFLANGFWREYSAFTVEPGKALTHEFPAGYAAHWLRVKADADCVATAQLVYK